MMDVDVNDVNAVRAKLLQQQQAIAALQQHNNRLKDFELESSNAVNEELAVALEAGNRSKAQNHSLRRTLENQAHTIELLLTKQAAQISDDSKHHLETEQKRAELDALDAELAAKSSTLQRCKDEVCKLEAAKIELQNDTQTQYERQSSELMKLKTQLQQTHTQVQRSNEDLALVDQDLTLKRSELTKVSQDLGDSERAALKVKHDLRTLETKIDTAKLHFEQTNTAVERSTSELCRVRAEIDESSQTKLELERQLKVEQQTLLDVEKQIDTSKKQFEQSTSDLLRVRAEIDEGNQAKFEIERLLKVEQTRLNELRRVERQIDASKTQFEHSKSELSHVHAEIQQSTQELSSLLSSIVEAKAQLEQLKCDTVSSTSTLMQTQAQLESVRMQLSRSQSSIEEAETQQAEVFKARMSRLEAELTQQTGKIQEANFERDDAVSQTRRLRQRLDALASEVEVDKQRIYELEMQLRHDQDEKQRVVCALEESVEALAIQKRELSLVQEETKKLNVSDELKRANAELKRAREDIQRKEAALRQHSSELDQKEVLMAELRSARERTTRLDRELIETRRISDQSRIRCESQAAAIEKLLASKEEKRDEVLEFVKMCVLKIERREFENESESEMATLLSSVKRFGDAQVESAESRFDRVRSDLLKQLSTQADVIAQLSKEAAVSTSPPPPLQEDKPSTNAPIDNYDDLPPAQLERTVASLMSALDSPSTRQHVQQVASILAGLLKSSTEIDTLLGRVQRHLSIPPSSSATSSITELSHLITRHWLSKNDNDALEQASTRLLELRRAEHERSTLYEESARLKHAHAERSLQCETLEAKLAQSTVIIQQKSDECTAITHEKASYSALLDEALLEIRSLETHERELSDRARSNASQLAECTAERDEARRALSRSVRRCEALQKAVDCATVQVNATLAEMDTLKQLNCAHIKELECSRVALATSEAKIRDHATQNAALEASREDSRRLRAALAELTNDSRKLRAEIETLQMRAEEASAAYLNVQRQHREAVRALQQRERELIDVIKAKSDVEKTLGQDEGQIQQLKDELATLKCERRVRDEVSTRVLVTSAAMKAELNALKHVAKAAFDHAREDVQSASEAVVRIGVLKADEGMRERALVRAGRQLKELAMQVSKKDAKCAKMETALAEQTALVKHLQTLTGEKNAKLKVLADLLKKAADQAGVFQRERLSKSMKMESMAAQLQLMTEKMRLLRLGRNAGVDALLGNKVEGEGGSEDKEDDMMMMKMTSGLVPVREDKVARSDSTAETKKGTQNDDKADAIAELTNLRRSALREVHVNQAQGKHDRELDAFVSTLGDAVERLQR